MVATAVVGNVSIPPLFTKTAGVITAGEGVLQGSSPIPAHNHKEALLQVQETIPTHVEHLLDTELQQHSALVQGQLSNGLKYVILPNAVPPERFEAHLEICAGRP